MKRTAAAPPVLSVCLIVRNCAVDLERCLRSVRDRAPQAEIICVDTMSGDDGATMAVAKQFADKVFEYTGPKGTWTREMHAFDDAAAARNESFRHATGQWVMWIDADDELVGPKEAQRLLELNGRWKPAGETAADTGREVSPEEYLAELAEKYPKLEGFWCPYLYRFADETGRAMTWQTRERIIRNNGKWTWMRAAHEVLAPIDPTLHRQLGQLPHWLFVHRKVFSEQDVLFSLTRHNAILERAYVNGERNFQDLMYLENYATYLAPAKRVQYIDDAMKVAFTPVDRARGLLRRANWNAEQGFYSEAIEALAGAIKTCPDLVDPHFVLGDMYAKTDQPFMAADAYAAGVRVAPGHPFSDVTPRDHLLKYRLLAAVEAHKASKSALQRADLNLADHYAGEALRLSNEALNEPCVGPDRMDAANWRGLFENERDALRLARELRSAWDYLVKNDETQKAMELLRVVPHNLEHHPIVVEMERWARRLKQHAASPAAYQKFYEEFGTDITSDADQTLGQLPRAAFAGEVLRREFKGEAFSLLEVGPFDGITAIPLMRAFPAMKFVGLEIKESAAKSLTERIKRLGFLNASVVHGQLADADKKVSEQFDAVVFFEVIEHVANVADAIETLARRVKPGGLLFVSTPWGAFDRGHQPSPETRDERGHVRAMTATELVEAVEASGLFVVEEQGGCHAEGNYGDTLHLVARRNVPIAGKRSRPDGSAYPRTNRHPITFAVAAALWDWNASKVINEGIGASEETIVYLARELATNTRLDLSVYGPLPKTFSLFDEEVNARVKYRPREAVRRIDASGPVIVSRAPGYGRMLDDATGAKLEKYLWLQDTLYPDTEATQGDYKKIVVLSEWHKELTIAGSRVDPAKLEVIPNFLLKEQFDPKGARVTREPHRFIYASSPDRGLIRLLKIWPLILKEWPDAKLGIFYGWEGCMKLGSGAGNAGWNQRYRTLREDFLKLRNQPGIEEHGRVNHARIAYEMRRASVWPYPTDFDETFCSNAMKARAAGCVPVCTPRAALNESALCAQTRYVEQERDGESWGDYAWRFFLACKEAVGVSEHERLLMADESIAKYDLSVIAPRWRKLLGL